MQQHQFLYGLLLKPHPGGVFFARFFLQPRGYGMLEA